MPDPYGTAGARIYRTGDRARLREDGQIEYLGRRDGLVKLRGHRIELGEVDARLERHPQVRVAVAAVRERTAGMQRLVAFVVCADGTDPDPRALRSFAAEQLPAFMVPAELHVLDDLPRTPSGKIDRAARCP